MEKGNAGNPTTVQDDREGKLGYDRCIMRELFSRAVVLDRKDMGDIDGAVSLFTEDFGKVVARATSIRKITSKLSGHLQPLSFVKVRLVQRAGPANGFTVADGIVDDATGNSEVHRRHDLLPALALVDALAPQFQTDRRVWHFLVEVFKKHHRPNQITRGLLTLFGFAPDHARCTRCSGAPPAAFVIREQAFVCGRCASKAGGNGIVYI